MFIKKLGKDLKGMLRVDKGEVSYYCINQGSYAFSIAKLDYRKRTLYLEAHNHEKTQQKLVGVLKQQMSDLYVTVVSKI